MKKWKRLLVSLLTVSMTLGASTMSVMADDTTQYTYKVTLSAGNKGTINGQSKIEKSDISYGSKFSFDNTALYNIQVTDDKSASADVIMQVQNDLMLLLLPSKVMPTM